MLSHIKGRFARVSSILSALIVLCTFATLAAAQDQPAPKWELYGGYSFFYPYANVNGLLPLGVLPVRSRLEANPRGAGAAGTYNFNRWLGLTVDTSINWNNDGEASLQKRIDDAGFSNLSIGPKFTYRMKHFSPFLEVLLGDQRLMPSGFHDVDKLGGMAGGGLDINLTPHVALRLLRGDFVYSNYRYGPASFTPETQVRGVRLQSGINLMFGGAPLIPPTAACSVQPLEVFAGEPVTATATGSNFAPKHTVKYSWTGTGVKVAGSEASTQIDTAGLAAGTYPVTASLSDGTKHGVANCTGSFTVKQPRPPVIACSPDPASVAIGGTSTIHSTASSPDGRTLTYSYTASTGQISGTGDSATLNTSGAQPGPITITCNVSDDRTPPLTASATTMVTVEAPPAPAPEIKELEGKLALHSIYFQTARPTAKHPEGGLVDSQADILKALAADFTNYLKYKPDARLTLSGHADPRGTAEFNKALTERRVERTKGFLVQNGVPQDRIETAAMGKDDQLTADQIKDQIAQNPDLSPADRQQMLKNLKVMVLANNRRVDVSLNGTGQQSLQRYPFNAKDYLALIDTRGEKSHQPAKRSKATHKHPAVVKP